MALLTSASRLSALVLLLALALTFVSAAPTKRETINACLARAKVPYDTKDSTQWAADTKPYNLRTRWTPAAVAIPSSTSQIQAAVKCGLDSSVRISAKAGGHSYGAFGFGGEDGHLVVILDRLYKVSLNTKSNVARIEPGARLGHVATELFNQGKRAIAHGSCPGVGVAGHVLHGGYGLASRTHGLTLDWLVGATVVLADGTKKHCSATENKDLFWAIRGAGSSFGIVTEFEFNTFPAPSQVTPFSVNLGWTRAQAVDGFKNFMAMADTAPKELNMQIYISPNGQTIQGTFYGDVNGLNAALKPMLGKMGATISKASTMGWIQSLDHFANGQALDQTYPYSMTNTFYSTSLATKTLNDAQTRSFVKALFDNSENASARHSWYILFDLQGGRNSVVAKVANDATAYPHRDKALLYQFSDSGNADGSYPAAGFSLLKGLRDSVTKNMKDGEWGMYANYLDTQLDGPTAQKLYYGSNLPRLQKIKATVDPKDRFSNPQGVKPAKK